MIAWMLYSVLVALILAASARAAEWIARHAGYRVRWIWIGALALTAMLSAVAVLRGRSAVGTPTGSAMVDLRGASALPPDDSWRADLRARLEGLRRSLEVPLRGVLATSRRELPVTANVYAATLSLLLSAGLLFVFVAVGRRLSAARRTWPLVRIDDVVVRVAPRIGPVVIGFMRPQVIVPRWLLERPAEEQSLVVAHEAEHVRARDPLVLAFAWAVVIAIPWNPAIWYMFSRLRLGVELDCDARVLRRGAAPRSYGSLLIDVAQHASPLRLSALALADQVSHLHERILAMKPTSPRFARLRSGLAATLALAGILIACQTRFPTDAEIERMDVATATRAAQQLATATRSDTSITYTIDGVRATPSEASALDPGLLDKVRIVRGSSAKPTEIIIDTRILAPKIAAGGSSRIERRALMEDGTAGPVDNVERPAALPKVKGSSFPGLIFIDGVRATDSQMKMLDPNQIESVDVLKRHAAAEYSSDPAATNGIILLKTKRGGKD